MPRPPRRFALVAVAACLAAACSLPGGGPPPPELKIGVDLPLSGPEASVGVPALKGVRFYVQQHPMLAGFSVSLVVKDDTTGGTAEPPLGATNLSSLAADPLVMGVIGPLDSSVARAEIPVANQAQLAMVSPATSSPCLTKSDYLPAALNTARVAISCKDAGLMGAAELRPTGVNNFFRLATTDDLQGPAAADFAYKTLKLLRVATISDHEGYGQALAAGFATRFRALGGSVVGRTDADLSGTFDLTAFLKRMKADGAQAIYFGGVSDHRACSIRAQMATVFDPGEAAPMLGGDGIAQDPVCIQDAGSNAAGIFATVPVPNPDDLVGARPAIAAFKAAYPNPADLGLYTMLAYDAAAVLYTAIERAIKASGGGLPPRGNVISQLSATQAFAGVSGEFGFDPNGDTTRRVLSVFESPAGDPRSPWKPAGQVDYTGALPY